MGQKDSYTVLKEMGGKAQIGEIRKYAKNRFPNATLYRYIGCDLRRLELWGRVKMSKDKNNRIYWEIIKKY